VGRDDGEKRREEKTEDSTPVSYRNTAHRLRPGTAFFPSLLFSCPQAAELDDQQGGEGSSLPPTYHPRHHEKNMVRFLLLLLRRFASDKVDRNALQVSSPPPLSLSSGVVEEDDRSLSLLPLPCSPFFSLLLGGPGCVDQRALEQRVNFLSSLSFTPFYPISLPALARYCVGKNA